MKQRHLIRSIAFGLIIGGGLLSADLEAYIDPGTGSYIFQIAIAFFIGLAFSFKVFRRKVAAFFRKILTRKKGNG